MNMHFSEDDIIQILKLVDESKFDELRLESNDLKLVVRKAGVCASHTTEEKIVQSSTQQTDGRKTLTESVPVQEDIGSCSEEKVAAEEGASLIIAPLLGTFYRRSEPNAPPFVEVGTLVGEDTTVCIIEVMKVFSTIKAGVKGYITKICVDNGVLVEYGQPLFFVKPL